MQRQRTTFTRICVACGREFLATDRHKSQRYHSRACYDENRVPSRRPLEERFWKHVVKTDRCWLWQGSLDGGGYGQMGVWEEGAGKQRLWKASRVSWVLHYGPISDGLFVCHNCPDGDNPRCVNPAHLFLDTNAGNIADAVAKGQMACGERLPQSKLTEPQVVQIRSLYAAGGITQQQLSDQFGINQSAVSRVISGQRWNHVK